MFIPIKANKLQNTINNIIEKYGSECLLRLYGNEIFVYDKEVCEGGKLLTTYKFS